MRWDEWDEERAISSVFLLLGWKLFKNQRFEGVRIITESEYILTLPNTINRIKMWYSVPRSKNEMWNTCWTVRGMCIYLCMCEWGREKIGRGKLSLLPFRKMTMIRDAHVDRGETVPMWSLIPSLSSLPTIKYPPFFNSPIPSKPHSQLPNSLTSKPWSIFKSPPRSPIPPHMETLSESADLHLDTS